MRRPAAHHLVLGLCYAVGLCALVDHLFWRRRGGAFNHR